ncbi:MAG TPA: thioredoxin family protein [Candidatus Acidoferrum sp.]|jgi:thioredoxin 1|nr:thioredoxin family protein [Candidatus Acidoferrum sp.]
MNRTTTGRFLSIAVLVGMAATMLGGQYLTAEAPAPDSTAGFPPLEVWKSAVIAGDPAALKALYSTDPAAHVQTNGVVTSTDADVSFWLGLKARSIQWEIVAVIERPWGMSVIFKAEVQSPNGQTLSITDGQGWRKQGEQWKLTSVERADAPHLKQPSDMNKNIYPADADARVEIKKAEEKAAGGRKRVLLVFGANWCYDCHVLDLAFHRPDFAAVMAGYEVVHIDLGEDEKKNADLVKQFDVPLNKGIPALAVAEADGKLVVSQKNGEFEDARSMTPEALLEFLNKWKPAAR